MITFCIDPGSDSGIAAFVNTQLLAARLFDGGEPDSAGLFVARLYLEGDERFREESVEVLVEVPRYYPGRSQVDANDLIHLACKAGRAAQAAKMLALSNTPATVAYVAPSDWKAQTDPDIMCERVLAKLDDAERAVVEKVFAAHGKKGMPKSLRHNVLDAIGIGLWRVGRMRSGGAGRT